MTEAKPTSAVHKSNSPSPSLPKLDDVAREAGVSTATVSRCLNNPEQVAIATRTRVLTAVANMGYSPNFGAKALAARRTNVFGAIIPTMENAIFARGIQAFEEELVLHNATLLVASSAYDSEREEQQIRSMVARGAEGLLLIGKRRRPEIYEFLDRQQVSVVLTWTSGRAGNRSIVGFDNIAASCALAERAIELGHTHFACISADQKNNDRARDRVTGVKKALTRHGIDPASLLHIESPYHIHDAGEAFYRLMQSPERPSVVMCGNDVQAVGAVLKAADMGLKVPEDVSITGFDDIELSTVVRPSITTVHVPHRKMGRLAAQSLILQMDGKNPLRNDRLQTHIVERESLGPAP